MVQKTTQQCIEIQPPDIRTLHIPIVGTTPLMMQAFWKKGAMQRAYEEEGKLAKATGLRDYAAEAEASLHRSTDGWVGMPASAFRAAMICACRISNKAVSMQSAKIMLFVEADGTDAREGVPLVRLDVGEHEVSVMTARNMNNGMDLRARPKWNVWGATLRVSYDASALSAKSVINLLMRAGRQVGIGEGRPDTTKSDSPGLGYGLFKLDAEHIIEERS